MGLSLIAPRREPAGEEQSTTDCADRALVVQLREQNVSFSVDLAKLPGKERGNEGGGERRRKGKKIMR